MAGNHRRCAAVAPPLRMSRFEEKKGWDKEKWLFPEKETSGELEKLQLLDREPEKGIGDEEYILGELPQISVREGSQPMTQFLAKARFEDLKEAKIVEEFNQLNHTCDYMDYKKISEDVVLTQELPDVFEQGLFNLWKDKKLGLYSHKEEDLVKKKFIAVDHCSRGSQIGVSNVVNLAVEMDGSTKKVGEKDDEEKCVEVCKALNESVQRAIMQEHEKAEWRKSQKDYNERKKAEYVSLPSGSDLVQHKRKKGALENSFNSALRDTADKEAARMFYASALPFNFAVSPYFRQYSRTLANGNLAGYTPPTYNRLRTTLLAQEKEHINRLLQPIRESWRKKGTSIVSDGWSDRSPQYAHCKWISDLVNDIQNIRIFIVNHSMALSIYNKHSKLSLLRVADTRFASSIIMAKRLRDVKKSLENMVMDADWRTYRDGNNESKAQEVKQCIVNDAWWDQLDYFLSFTEPIMNMLRAADTDTPILHLIYDMWDTMIEDVKKIVFDHEGKDMIGGSSSFFDVIHQILEARWNKSNTPLHCIAHSLVPKYYCEAWLQEETLG
ncbi:hypothetical protein C2S52_007576 [Perilla frutescens var. hirtella]|nr:hypothetical protein C2S52_007576 [Perilla frutescens var. hirtella]